ncbi:MAG: argininosuccinate lyase [Acidobacteria bacterium RIFCSPLOWO2_12_FULL_59_11]|nr:MAG: argininosuccinate lyase [Acidobacteria bacterium RIFCSPLOWO2_12_FULL_59_11]
MKKPPQTPYKLWGGRFEKGPSAQLESFSRSLDFDYRLALADIQGTKAYVRALESAQILSCKEAAQALRGLDALAREIAIAMPESFRRSPEEDIHTFILARLRERIGVLADKLHTGRSRNEQVALDFRLWVKDAVRSAQSALKDLLAALLGAAEKHPSVLLPGYTHLRRAQPVLWSHYLLAYFEMFRRDHHRLEACLASTDVMPLGSGALAGSGLAFDRRKFAKQLGFSRISRNSLDAVSDRDFALEFLFSASLCFLHLSRLAEDWILYSSEEFGFLELAEEVSTGSSLMPQKKNPDSLELIRGKTGRVLGSLVSLATTLKGLPLTYNRDLQEDKEPVFDAAAQLPAALAMAAQVVRTVSLHPETMKKAATDGWLCATDLAEFLASKGVPFHQAHQIVGKLVLDSVRAGKQPQDCSLNDLKRYSSHFDKTCLSLLSPEAGVARRAVPGGTAPSRVRQAVREARTWLESI